MEPPNTESTSSTPYYLQLRQICAAFSEFRGQLKAIIEPQIYAEYVEGQSRDDRADTKRPFSDSHVYQSSVEVSELSATDSCFSPARRPERGHTDASHSQTTGGPAPTRYLGHDQLRGVIVESPHTIEQMTMFNSKTSLGATPIHSAKDSEDHKIEKAKSGERPGPSGLFNLINIHKQPVSSYTTVPFNSQAVVSSHACEEPNNKNVKQAVSSQRVSVSDALKRLTEAASTSRLPQPILGSTVVCKKSSTTKLQSQSISLARSSPLKQDLPQGLVQGASISQNDSNSGKLKHHVMRVTSAEAPLIRASGFFPVIVLTDPQEWFSGNEINIISPAILALPLLEEVSCRLTTPTMFAANFIEYIPTVVEAENQIRCMPFTSVARPVVSKVTCPVQTAESSLSESSMGTCRSSATCISNTNAESDELFCSFASEVGSEVQTAKSSLSESSLVTCWSSATGIAKTNTESVEPFHSLASEVRSSVQWTERGFSESAMVSCRRDTSWRSASLNIGTEREKQEKEAAFNRSGGWTLEALLQMRDAIDNQLSELLAETEKNSANCCKRLHPGCDDDDDDDDGPRPKRPRPHFDMQTSVTSSGDSATQRLSPTLRSRSNYAKTHLSTGNKTVIQKCSDVSKSVPGECKPGPSRKRHNSSDVAQDYSISDLTQLDDWNSVALSCPGNKRIKLVLNGEEIRNEPGVMRIKITGMARFYKNESRKH